MRKSIREILTDESDAPAFLTGILYGALGTSIFYIVWTVLLFKFT